MKISENSLNGGAGVGRGGGGGGGGGLGGGRDIEAYIINCNCAVHLVCPSSPSSPRDRCVS